MDGLQAVPIPGTEGAHNPFFSPDGQWVGFNAAYGQLKKISLSGGASVSLSDVTAGQVSGTSWGSQGIIAFAPQANGPIYQIPETGGNLEPLTRLEKTESGHRWPELLPGGKGLVFMLPPNNNPKIVAQTLGTNEHRDLQQAGIFPRFISKAQI
jgi:serine/threonine-protein kinase